MVDMEDGSTAEDRTHGRLLLRLMGYGLLALAVLGIARAVYDDPRCDGCDFFAGVVGLIWLAGFGAFVLALELWLHERRTARAAEQGPPPGRSDWDD